MTIATAEKNGGLGNQQPSRFHPGLLMGMMRKVQRLAERRRAKRPEMRGLHMRATRPIAERFAEKVARGGADDCHEWIGCIMPNGYGQINQKGTILYAHRVAWELANGTIPKGAFVIHSCDNRRCVNIAHLRLGSYLDNINDMTSKLRHAHGRRNGHAILTVKKVKAIRAASGTQAVIAERFGVSQSLVSMIRTRRIWKYV